MDFIIELGPYVSYDLISFKLTVGTLDRRGALYVISLL